MISIDSIVENTIFTKAKMVVCLSVIIIVFILANGLTIYSCTQLARAEKG